jgi:hypothetical protein
MIRILAKKKKAITLTFVFLFTAFGIQSSHASYYPSGIQQNVSEQTLIDNGWKKFYEQNYSTANSSTGSEFRPSESFIIVTGKSIGSNILTTVAAAPTNSVFTETSLNAPQLLNGTYWYYTPATSFGYSPTNQITQATADVTGCNGQAPQASACESDPSRLSWHLDGFNGGYRLGNAGWINNDGSGGNLYLKQVWSWDGTRAGTSAGPATAVRQTHNLSFSRSLYGSDTLSDPDGELRKTVNSIEAKYGDLIK